MSLGRGAIDALQVSGVQGRQRSQHPLPDMYAAAQKSATGAAA
jgi:hypothetical protein